MYLFEYSRPKDGVERGLCRNMLEFFSSEMLSAPSLGRFWKQTIGGPYYRSRQYYESKIVHNTEVNKYSTINHFLNTDNFDTKS